MNRKQRRAADKRQPLNIPMSQQKLLSSLCKNGITQQDLKDEFFRGVEAGRRQTIKIVYAAVLYAARDELKFGGKRMDRLIKAGIGTCAIRCRAKKSSTRSTRIPATG